MASLQEQLLKAGLTTKDKATKAKSAKRKQNKVNRKHKIEIVDLLLFYYELTNVIVNLLIVTTFKVINQ